MSIQDKKYIEMIDSIPLKGPFELCQMEIDLFIPDGTTGNYLLGYVNIHDKLFNVLYSGHAVDLNKTLKKLIRYFSHFKFTLTESLYEAFINDCMLYHFYKEKSFILNVSHPAPPDGNSWRCSLCGKDGTG